MIDDEWVIAHRERGLTPDTRLPFAAPPKTRMYYFQARETVNPFYEKCADMTQKAMDKFGKLTGRQYNLFDYAGAPDAERVIIDDGLRRRNR